MVNAESRRGRGPSPHKTAQTRQAVARAALELFIEQGYRGTPMSDVAERAGVAKGTVYRYFADKQALFAGVISDVLDDRVAALRAAEPGEGESLRNFLSRVVTPLLATVEGSPSRGASSRRRDLCCRRIRPSFSRWGRRALCAFRR